MDHCVIYCVFFEPELMGKVSVMSFTVCHHQSPLKLKFFNPVYVLYNYYIYINRR
jgi:hypothetical protein